MNLKDEFVTWLKEAKPNITRPDKYYKTIMTISNHLVNSKIQDINLYEVEDSIEVIRLKDLYFSYNVYYSLNKTGKNMYSRSLDLYIEFLEINKQRREETKREIDNALSDVKLTTRQKQTIVLSRLGQGKYREDLIALWRGCAISRYDDVRILIASHLKPWRVSTNTEKIDKHNGLLLLPTYDKLLDLGFISFEDNGKIMISKYLRNYDKLGISNQINIKVKNENAPYLKFHREDILKR